MQHITTPDAVVLRPADVPATPRNTLLAWGGAATILIALVAPIILQRYLTFDPRLVSTFGYMLVFGLGVIGSLTFFLPIPVLPLVFTGSTMLNPFLLALAAAAGITLGMAGCYILGKAGHSLATKAQPHPGTKMHRLTSRLVDWYASNVTVASFVVAATPNPVFDYAGYIAGITGVDRNRFLFATFAGKVVQSMVVALLGYYAFERISSWW